MLRHLSTATMPVKPKRPGSKASRQNKTNPTESMTLSLRISESWYKNPKLSDITIKYGANGTKVFHGPRLVLCNLSEWFRSSLCGGFKEADEREITLKDDYADGLEGLFEFCYRGTYTCTTGAASGLAKAMKRFLRDARVFIVGGGACRARFEWRVS
jgi:hypothetical protein